MSEKKMTSIGGQAVIEGIMMKGPDKIAVAVRKPDGEIVIDERENKIKGGLRKIPIVRGVVAFVDSMVTGIKALMFSANFYEEDGTPKEESTTPDTNVDNNNDAEKDNIEQSKLDVNDKKSTEKTNTETADTNETATDKAETTDTNNTATDKAETADTNNTETDKVEDTKKTDKKDSGELSPFMMFVTVLTSLAFSVGLFIALPNLIAGFAVPNVQTAGGSTVILYNVVESVVKIGIFLCYLILVSNMKDIRRVFEYHGAEHKTIFCYENGEELTVENVKKFKRFHPRCGTSFLLFVIIISIIVFSLVGRFDSKIVNILVRIALLPVVAGISYEIIRFAGKHTEDKWISWLNKPGMWLQRLTTREPDDSQIEVAIKALKVVIPKDKNADNW